MQIKVLSWNIWQGYHLDLILETLREQNPDIIGLQEVPEKDGTNVAQVLAEKLQYHCAYFRAIDMTRLGTPMGNAILSKLPIAESKRHFLSEPELYKGDAETE